MGLGVTLTTLQPGTEAKAEDVNSNSSALNGAVQPTFQFVTLTPTGSSDDTVTLYDRNGVKGANLGWAQSGGGLYAWDDMNSGYIFSGGTKTGITFPGIVFATTQLSVGASTAQSALSIDTTGHWVNYWTPSQSSTPYGSQMYGWNGSTQVIGLQIQPSGVAYIGTNRNGTTTTVPIYTGYTGGANPSNPPTGSIRIDA